VVTYKIVHSHLLINLVIDVWLLSLIIRYNASMTRKTIPKLLITIIIIILLLGGAAVGFFMLRQSQQQGGQQGQQNGQQQGSSTTALQASTVDYDTFSYEKPEGWAKLSKERLADMAAVSGVALPAEDLTKLPVASVTMRVSDSTPANDNDLKKSVTKEIEKFPEFKQLEFADVQVGDKTGKKFVYTYANAEDKAKKIKQQLSVVVNNGKTFFVLYSTEEPVFDQHKEKADSILSSFKFK